MTTLLSRLLLAVFCCSLVAGCATNPVTGKRQISFISEEKEIQMGQSYDPQVVAEFGIYDNAPLAQFLNSEGQKMAAISERPNLPWTFRLVDSEVVNAFAVPGGFVYFTRGIMAHFNNEAQFAGVLGHEIGHVTARHTVQQQSKQTLAQIGMIGGMILSPEIASQGEALMQGMQLLFLKFGRDAEEQSDKLGVAYSTQIGYDASEMAGFFSTLDRLSGGAENRAPTFLSTHPDPLNREERVQGLAVEYQAAVPETNFEVGRDSYLRRIDGMIYGADPKQGFVEGQAFYHPDLRFQFSFPNGWRVLNAPTQVQIVAPNQDALVRMQLAQGTDTRGTARQFVEQTQLQNVRSTDQQINGLPATIVTGQAVQQAQQGQRGQTIGVLAAFIAYNGSTYAFTGLGAQNTFNRNQRAIESIIGSFSELNDQSKINREPDRIRIVSNPRAQTLQQALLGAGIPNDRLEELSVLNGMTLNQQLPAGTLFKALSQGNMTGNASRY